MTIYCRKCTKKENCPYTPAQIESFKVLQESGENSYCWFEIYSFNCPDKPPEDEVLTKR